MEDAKIALRYAKSLFDLSRQQNVMEVINRDMVLVADVCQSSKHLVNMLRSPIINHNKKQTILHAVFRNKVHALALSFLQLVTTKNREKLIPLMAFQFHAVYNNFKRIQPAKITSPISLDQSLRDAVKRIVQKYSGREEIELEERVNTELIGGFILDIEDRQLDTSIKTHLESLKQLLTKNTL